MAFLLIIFQVRNDHVSLPVSLDLTLMVLREGVIVERRRLSERSCRKYQLIDCYESAKLPVYIPKKKLGTQPLIRSLRSGSPFGSPGAECDFQS
jgi:hypothetical protein